MSSSLIFFIPAILTSLVAALLIGRHLDLSLSEILLYFFGTVSFGYLISHLNARFIYYEQYHAIPYFYSLKIGGVVSYGFMAGAALFTVIEAWLRDRSPLIKANYLATVLPLCSGILRFSCLFNGCCFGKETNSIFGLYMPAHQSDWTYRYPTQPLFILFNFALFIFFMQNKGKSVKGFPPFFTFLFLYSIGRFFIDFLRGDSIPFYFLNKHQVSALVLFLMSIAFWHFWKKRNSNE